MILMLSEVHAIVFIVILSFLSLYIISVMKVTLLLLS